VVLGDSITRRQPRSLTKPDKRPSVNGRPCIPRSWAEAGTPHVITYYQLISDQETFSHSVNRRDRQAARRTSQGSDVGR
jgi:hypothetical protein